MAVAVAEAAGIHVQNWNTSFLNRLLSWIFKAVAGTSFGSSESDLSKQFQETSDCRLIFHDL